MRGLSNAGFQQEILIHLLAMLQRKHLTLSINVFWFPFSCKNTWLKGVKNIVILWSWIIYLTLGYQELCMFWGPYKEIDFPEDIEDFLKI